MPETPNLSQNQILQNTLQAKLERVFRRVQECYDLSRHLDDPKCAGQFKARCSRLDSSFQEFGNLTDELHKVSLKLDPTTTSDSFAQRALRFEELYFAALEAYEELNARNLPSVQTTSTEFNVSRQCVRLPRIELKQFDGTLSQWAEFKSVFLSLIHENPSLDGTAKFHYLRSSLFGPALALISELPLTRENYAIAWKVLEERFENKRILGSELLNKLLLFPPLKRDSDSELSQLVSTFSECVASLKVLAIKDLSDFMLLHIALKCLPSGLHKAFERAHITTEIPTLGELLVFLQQQSQILELVTPSSNKVFKAKSTGKPRSPTLVSQPKPTCLQCKGAHLLFACPAFNKLTVAERRLFTTKNKLCFNCFRADHMALNCTTSNRCKRCNASHHTLLHDQPKFTPKPASLPASSPNVEETSSDASHALSAVSYTSSTALLGTALFQVRGNHGKFFTVRGIIDSGASTSFITTKCANDIGLNFRKSRCPIAGIGNQPVSQVVGAITCFIKPCTTNEPILSTETLVIPEITSRLPCAKLSTKVANSYRALELADPSFNVPGPVDFLIGSDIFPHIYTGNVKHGIQGTPSAMDSIFGWIITGRCNIKKVFPAKVLLSTDRMLRQFWEIEELPSPLFSHPDDIVCEQMYKDEHFRLSDGRYVTPLMLKKDVESLGESYHSALNRLLGIERRLNKDSQLHTAYSEFLEEYEQLGHMSPVDSQIQNNYFIPHHYVLRDSSLSTKLRVVFDASQKTSSGVSLNDVVYTGPKLQKNIFDIIFRFRLYNIVFTCDISKMYRQILVRPEDRNSQHILWRKDGKLQQYELNTVTYGVASAPFVALRTLQQLAIDEGDKFPDAANVLREEVYIDDIVTGAKTVQGAKELQRQVIELFKLGQFEVRKWSSNHPEILKQIPPEHCTTSFMLNDENKNLKILGVCWNAETDTFCYDAKISDHECTKRNILSHIARIYDPLGWISPIVFYAKALMQRLWLLGLDWDSKAPDDVAQEWQTFCQYLRFLNLISIERPCLLIDALHYSLVGFSDASQAGYAAVVYLRSASNSSVKVSLLAAKSKVAPTKTVSVPRLELCGAQLLTSLIGHCQRLLQKLVPLDNIFAFTDSQVVLAWIKTTPCLLKTFVANRVSFIIDNLDPSVWRHVATDDNPADIASRGCFPNQLHQHKLWWTGPKWLPLPFEDWPQSSARSKTSNGDILAETKPVKTSHLPVLITSLNSDFIPLISRFSSLMKLQRVTARILRVVHNLKWSHDLRSCSNSTIDPPHACISGIECPFKGKITDKSILVSELDQSLRFLIKVVQETHFSDEMKSLKKSEFCSKQLRSLHPFLDKDGLIRVGGRLRNAKLPYDSTHPFLLPKLDPLVNLIIDYYHKRYLHAGPRTLQSLLSRKFWILAARSIIRSRLGKCVICFRAKPSPMSSLMGDLPTSRVLPSKIFSEVGVDFGGPFIIRESKRRNSKCSKVYLCLFICMAVKAVHLEVVSALSTDAFLACLDRFVSRRGLCHTVHSDNGTNFTGAKRHLSELFDFLLKNKSLLDEELTTRQIQWKFIPPSAPHFGGLWEAGIKSAKFHLRRVIGEQTLTYEELTTVVSKVEAIMNSRPLCALSSDAAESDVLTPGHFLIGGPIVAVPEVDFTETPMNRLDRWQLLQQMTQQFWKIWSQDYLLSLQQRTKWRETCENVKTDDIVLISDKNSMSTQWKMGKVENVHPGCDGTVRVVTIKVNNGFLRRPVTAICKLPIA